MAEEDYIIREANKNDINAIIQLLEDHYINDETVFKSYSTKNKSKYTQEESTIEEDTQNILQYLLTTNTSLVAIHKSDEKIVGTIMLAKPLIPRPQELIKSKYLNNLFFHTAGMYKNSKLSEKYPEIQSQLQLRFLGTDIDHRQKGLSSMLINKAVEYAREQEIDLVHGIFSSKWSKKAAENAGLKSIAVHDLHEIVDADGERVFADTEPDHVVSIMALQLKK